MKNTLSVAIILALAVACYPQGGPGAKANPLVFKNVTVIDTTGGPAKPEMTVIITDGRISEIGPTKTVRILKGAEVVDATGKFLIPGLWDMHVHLYDESFFPLFIANGVTGVRTMWGFPPQLESRKQIEAGKLLGPRLLIASPIVDGPNPVWPESTVVSNEAEGRQAVVKLKQDGYDFIKVYSLLPRAAYLAIADEAKKQGIPFAGHVPNSVTASEASDAGQRTIEHVTGILASCSSREDEYRKAMREAYIDLPAGQRFPGPDRTRPLTRMLLGSFSSEKAIALSQQLKRNQTWQCPTLTVLRSTAFLNDPELAKDPRLKYMPKELRDSWDPSADFRFKQRTAEDFELARLTYRKQLELVGIMHRSGAEFLAGTDVLNPYCFPGFSLHDELALLVQAGFTPLEALQTATLNPARFLGREKELGSVDNGKLADLVLLDANPLEDIKNTQRIYAVVVRGKLIPRTELARMLANAEAAAR